MIELGVENYKSIEEFEVRTVFVCVLLSHLNLSFLGTQSCNWREALLCLHWRRLGNQRRTETARKSLGGLLPRRGGFERLSRWSRPCDRLHRCCAAKRIAYRSLPPSSPSPPPPLRFLSRRKYWCSPFGLVFDSVKEDRHEASACWAAGDGPAYGSGAATHEICCSWSCQGGAQATEATEAHQDEKHLHKRIWR